jgi:phosphoglycerol geranylgeranyltransferase
MFGKKPGKVENYYSEVIERDGAMLFSLIDPDKTSYEQGAKMARLSCEAGADAILVGGSIGAQGELLDQTVKLMKENVNIPVVLFPGNISGLTKYADAAYMMYMLNSRDVYWISTAQIQAAPIVERLGLEAIPTSYLVLEPGRAVGWIGNANLLPRSRPDLAYACGLASKHMGAHVVITDSGSGAPEPAPLEIISAVAKACNGEVFYSYGGGVQSDKQATSIIKAGANAIQIGTAFEKGDIAKKISTISHAIKKEGKKRV